MFCDWYETTIYDNHQSVMNILAENLKGKWERQQKGMKGYLNQHILMNENRDKLATILHGSNNLNQQLPHILATGRSAESFRNLVRSEYKNHLVSRIDVAEDFQGDKDTFLDFVNVAQTIADRMGVSTQTVGDWLGKDNANGRTFYMGSPKSALMMRIYEKGKELSIKGKNRGLTPIPEQENIIRVELQCRPQKEQRIKAASLNLEECWGLSRWSKVVAKEIFSIEVPTVARTRFRLNKREETLYFLCYQYKNFIKGLAEELGSWDLVGHALNKIIQEIESNKL